MDRPSFRKFPKLPDDVNFLISYLLNISSALSLCQVFPDHEYCKDEEFWKNLVNKQFPKLTRETGRSWKDLAKKFAVYENYDLEYKLLLAFEKSDMYAVNYFFGDVPIDTRWRILLDILKKAIDKDSVETVVSIVKYGLERYRPALFDSSVVYAVTIGSNKVLPKLLTMVKPNIHDSFKEAVDIDNLEALKIILKYGNVGREEIEWRFIQAVNKGKKEIIDFFLTLDVEQYMNDAIYEAIKTKRYELMKYLESKTKHVDVNRMFAASAEFNDPYVAEYYISKGADNWRRASFIAVINGNLSFLEKYINKLSPENLNGLLESAVIKSNFKIVDFLIDNGATDLNTALKVVVDVRHDPNISMIKHLISRGADNLNGAVLLAIQHKHDELVDILIKLGASDDKMEWIKRRMVSRGYGNQKMWDIANEKITQTKK